MTLIIFFEWLKLFDALISRNPDGKVFLRLEKFSGHVSVAFMAPLSHAEVKYLPPNATPRLQPMYVGIIASLKCPYHTLQYNMVLDVLDSESNIYKVDQLTALRYVKSVWNQILSSVLANILKHVACLNLNPCVILMIVWFPQKI